jgi:hypothetical protein
VPSEQRNAAASQFVAALGATMAAANYAVFTATLISMMSIAVGVQTGLLLFRAAIQLTSSPNRRVIHD